MKRVKVGFWGIDSILEFVKITGSSRHKMELVCGSTVVDAKSLLSVLSVKAAQAVELVIHEESSAGPAAFRKKTDRKRNLKN